MVYLGGVIIADGHNTSEINPRIGLADSEFSSLQKVWLHANLSGRKKIALFYPLVVPNLKSFDRIALLDHYNYVREMIFEPDDSFMLKSSSFHRKRGRPRLTWASEDFKIEIQISNSISLLQSLVRSYAHSPRE